MPGAECDHVVMPEPSERLISRIRRDFTAGTAAEVVRCLTMLETDAYGGQDVERVQAALVVAAAGSWKRFTRQLALLAADWRDVLLSGGLENADWPRRLTAELPDGTELSGATELPGRRAIGRKTGGMPGPG